MPGLAPTPREIACRNLDSDDLIKGINAPERETYLYRDKPRVSRCARFMSRRHAKGIAASIGAACNESIRARSQCSPRLRCRVDSERGTLEIH